MKRLYFLLLFSGSLSILQAQKDSTHFVFTIHTDSIGQSNDSAYILNIDTLFNYNYDVDWNNDGIFDDLALTDSISHQYNQPGSYSIRIRGTFPKPVMGIPTLSAYGDWEKLISIDQWGTTNWKSMKRAFINCKNMIYKANDIPNLDSVKSCESMFSNATSFNGDIGKWDVSSVSNMISMFDGAASFNQDIGNWDVSSVNDMTRMFQRANSFNQDIGNWNVSSVNFMSSMFWQAFDFNQDISSWDVSNVMGMDLMFFGAFSFNQSIGSWDVSNVKDMFAMFADANSFNQNIGNWDVSNVTNMSQMFSNATSFNQDIGNWDVSAVTRMDYLFLKATSFNQTIENWNVSNVISMFAMFSGAISFNQKIGTWDVSGVFNMGGMFNRASAFDQNIGDWDVSSVGDMNRMFQEATSFNQKIGDWDVSSVRNMEAMFNKASSFNQDIGDWDVSSARDMDIMFQLASNFNQDIRFWNTSSCIGMAQMFDGAKSFNQNLGNWDLSSTIIMLGMLDRSGISITNYDSTLISWQAKTHPKFQSFGAYGLNYCNSNNARSELIKEGWSFFGDTLNCFAERVDPSHFVTTWKTDHVGISNDSSITIKVDDNEFYNFDIDWNNDGFFEDIGVKKEITHQYDSAGTYTIRIKGNFPKFYFDLNGQPQHDAQKLISIDQWGDMRWKDLSHAFAGCRNLTHEAVDTPNLDSAKTMFRMFAQAKKFNGAIGNWDVSSVTNMAEMFSGASSFNQDIGDWDVSNVTNMSQMFNNASAFNQDIGNWDVSSVSNMSLMFRNLPEFNKYIGDWNVSNVKNIAAMFLGSSSFNQDLGNWDISKVSNMSAVFFKATSFDQNLGNWNINSALDMSGMLDNSGLSTANYDSLLIQWQAKPHEKNITLGAAGLQYCAADSARQRLIDEGWIISGDSLVDKCFTALWENTPNTEKQFSIFPNPTSGETTLQFKKNPTDGLISIYNTKGQLIEQLRINATSSNIQLDFYQYPNGLYLIRSSNQWEKVMVRR